MGEYQVQIHEGIWSDTPTPHRSAMGSKATTQQAKMKKNDLGDIVICNQDTLKK